MTAKPVAARVAELRKRRAALGLTRLELYAHPDDHAPLKALAARLARKRAKETTTMLTNELRSLVTQAHELLDPAHQGSGWPDPIAWDGRPIDQQARDLCVLLDEREDDSVAADLSSQLWALCSRD